MARYYDYWRIILWKIRKRTRKRRKCVVKRSKLDAFFPYCLMAMETMTARMQLMQRGGFRLEAAVTASVARRRMPSLAWWCWLAVCGMGSRYFYCTIQKLPRCAKGGKVWCNNLLGGPVGGPCWGCPPSVKSGSPILSGESVRALLNEQQQLNHQRQRIER